MPVGNHRDVALACRAMNAPGDAPKAGWQSQRLAATVMPIWDRVSMAGHVWLGSSVMTDRLCHSCRLGSGHGDEPSCREGSKKMAELSRPWAW
jgi:hypothetical protein